MNLRDAADAVAITAAALTRLTERLRPLRALALLAIVALGFLGAIVWDQRVHLLAVIVRPDAEVYGLAEDRAPAVLAELLRTTQGQVAVLHEMDVQRNRRRLIVAVARDGRQMGLEPAVLPIIRTTRQPEVVLPSLLVGQTLCLDVDARRTPPDLLRVSQSENLTSYCVGPVATAFGVLEGALTVMFTAAPADETAVAVALRAAAGELVRLRRRP